MDRTQFDLIDTMESSTVKTIKEKVIIVTLGTRVFRYKEIVEEILDIKPEVIDLTAEPDDCSIPVQQSPTPYPDTDMYSPAYRPTTPLYYYYSEELQSPPTPPIITTAAPENVTMPTYEPYSTYDM